jgi:hypothetical protein
VNSAVARDRPRRPRRILRLGEARGRSEASFLDDRPNAGRDATFQPRQRRDGDPTGEDELRPSIRGHCADSRQPSADRGEIDVVRFAGATEQDELERPIDIERESPPRSQVAHLVAGHSPSHRAGRCRIEVRHGDSDRPGRSRPVRGEPVVGQGDPVVIAAAFTRSP